MILHAFNSHVSTGASPCINEAIHMLLMQRFGTLNILVPGNYIFAADLFIALIDGPGCKKIMVCEHLHSLINTFVIWLL